MSCLNEEQMTRIGNLVAEIEKLSDIEKLFLYIKLPSGKASLIDSVDTGKSTGKSTSPSGLLNKSGADLFSKKHDQETTQTYTWILSHLEVDPNVSLPKQEVYDEYRAFCQANHFEPLCVADFGKAMKHAFPCIKPRRLGQRGNSRYCYSGLRKRYKIVPPSLPDMAIGQPPAATQQHAQAVCTDTNCQQSSSNPMPVPMDHHTSGKCCTDVLNPTNNCLQAPNSADVMNLKVEPNEQQINYNNNSNSMQPMQHQPQPANLNHQEPAMPDLSGSQICTGGSDCHLNRDPMFGRVPPSGTPDDDDYKHNYRDTLYSIDGHMINQSVNIPSHATQHQQSNDQAVTGTTSANQTNNHTFVMYDQSSRLSNDTSTHQMAPVAPQQRQPQSQPQMPSNPQTNNNNSNHHQHHTINQFSQLNSVPVSNHQDQQATHHQGASLTFANNSANNNNMNSTISYDSCASPFQSPASTPFPMTGHMSYDIQDYYSDCIPYTN